MNYDFENGKKISTNGNCKTEVEVEVREWRCCLYELWTTLEDRHCSCFKRMLAISLMQS